MHSHSAKPHIFGYLLSLCLTLLAFGLMLYTTLPLHIKITLLLVLAVLQLLIQLIFFMHIGESNEKVYQVITIGYAIFIAAATIAGSIWIMSFHAEHMMM